MRKGYELPDPGGPFDPDIFYLGAPCKRRHVWEDGKTLRLRKRKVCILCDRLDAIERQHARRSNPEIKAEINKRNADRMARLRATCGRTERAALRQQGLTTRGTTPVSPLGAKTREEISLVKAVRAAGRFPSVAELVQREQRRYWRNNPEAHSTVRQIANRERAKWKHLLDRNYQLYHRQKSKRRKALLRGSIGLHVKPSQLKTRFAEFDHRCAYCGISGADLQIEHVIPIAKGGTHTLGNIVPACKRCNFSKKDKEAESWFRSQPFFTERRWRTVRRVLGWDRCSVGQLSLL